MKKGRLTPAFFDLRAMPPRWPAATSQPVREPVAPVEPAPVEPSNLTNPKNRRRALLDHRDGSSHIVHRVGGPDDHVAAGLDVGQRDLEVLAPRVGDPVLRIDDSPTAGIERV